jgi:hypothetical protein
MSDEAQAEVGRQVDHAHPALVSAATTGAAAPCG